MQWFFDSLRRNVGLALFFTLAPGHALRRLRPGTFQPGPVPGALVAGVGVGQLGIAVPAGLKNALFQGKDETCAAGSPTPARRC